jgi:cephalosporin-C deacetylase-like acetyl esterase
MTPAVPRSIVVLLLLSIFPLTVRAQFNWSSGQAGDAQIEKYLAAETDRLSKRVFDGATTLAEWQQRRPRLRQEYLYMLGLWPLPEKTPLKATVTGKTEHDGIVIENLHFQSRPGLYVTANLYRPRASGGRKPPVQLPTILYLCGHSGRGRDGNKSAFQDHGLWFAHNGYVCLILDTLQLGEIPGHHHGTYGIRAHLIKGQAETRWWWHSRGYTPAGVECWNGVRAIDYLLTRPEVDPERIGVTGISGGGAATFWVAAADERVQCAVPVSGMSDLESYIKHNVINGHCDCMFLYNTYQWEWTTIAALIAPRPLLFANSDKDSIFPMDGNRRIIGRLRKLYQWYGKPELVDEYVSHGGHDYRPDLRVAVFKWLNKHLKHDTGPVEDTRYKELPARKLRVFPEDSDIPKDVLNGKIDEVFVPRAVVQLPKKGQFAGWKKKMVDDLRSQVFRPFPKALPEGKPRRGNPHVGFEIKTEANLAAFVIHSGIGDEPKDELLTLCLLGQQDVQQKEVPAWIKEHGKQYREVEILIPRGPAEPWTIKSPPNYVARAHALLGRTVDQGRVRDVVATARYLAERLGEPHQTIRVVGRGQSGILCAYAALFEPSIKEVVVIDPPTSHMQGPYFLNVMRVLDIPEALGLLAPRVRLTLVNARDRAFDRTAEIYRLAGAAGKFRRK